MGVYITRFLLIFACLVSNSNRHFELAGKQTEQSFLFRFDLRPNYTSFSPLAKINTIPTRFASFNIRFDTFLDFFSRSWRVRRDLVVESIKRIRPAIVGLQETDLFQISFLKDVFSNTYTHFGVPRDRKNGEGNGILVDKSVFTVLDYGNFSNSSVPQQIGSISWGSSCERITTWVKVFSALTGELLVVNTHLDYLNKKVRQLSVKAILKEIPQSSKILFMGDFNGASTEFSSLLAEFKDIGKQANDKTFHNFTGKASERLDYIFAKGFDCSNYLTHKDEFNGIYPSDHFAISCEFNDN